jgi:hypothetical protein
MRIKINVTRTSAVSAATLFQAKVGEHSLLCGYGSNASEAIGDLLISYPELFNVNIQTPWKPYDYEDAQPTPEVETTR